MIVLIGCSGLVGLMTLSVPSVEGKSIGSLKREAFINVLPVAIKYPSQPVQFFIKREAFHRLLFACASTTALTRDQLMAEKRGELSQ